MRWQYTPYIVPLLIATIISLTIARHAWQRRTTLEAKTFLWLAILVAIWTFGYALELGGADLPTKIFWAKIQYLAIARRAVIEGLKDGVVVIDTQNRVVDINPAAQQAIKRNASAAI